MSVFTSIRDVATAPIRASADLLSSAGKEFKRFSKTDLGKAALVGAAIYFTGPAGAGWWGEPAAAGATAAGTEAAAPSLAMSTIGDESVASAGLAGGTSGAVAPAAAAPAVAPVNIPTVTGATTGASEGTAAGGNWFTNLHPLAQYGLLQSGLGAVQGAFTPNAIDVERERARLAREEDERRKSVANQNTAVGPINFRMAARPQALLAPRMGSV